MSIFWDDWARVCRSAAHWCGLWTISMPLTRWWCGWRHGIGGMLCITNQLRPPPCLESNQVFVFAMATISSNSAFGQGNGICCNKKNNINNHYAISSWFQSINYFLDHRLQMHVSRSCLEFNIWQYWRTKKTIDAAGRIRQSNAGKK